MSVTKINADIMDLTDAYAFTGDVSGAGGGKVLQVVTDNYVSGGTGTSASSTTRVDTPLSLVITSIGLNSKFHIIANSTLTHNSSYDQGGSSHLARVIGGTTTEFPANYGCWGGDNYSYSNSASNCILYLDSPSQAIGVAITYKVQISNIMGSSPMYWGITVGTRAQNQNLTIMEISA